MTKTQGAIGANTKISATWDVYAYQRNEDGSQGELLAYERIKNMWATAGLAKVLDSLRQTSITSASAVGLISTVGFSALSLADTISSHAGWVEYSAYTGTRKVPQWQNASGRSISAPGVVFMPTAPGNVKGAFLALGLSGGADTLGSMVKFSSPIAVSTGIVLIIDITVSLSSPTSTTGMLTNLGAQHWLDRIFRSTGAVPSIRAGLIAASPTLAAADAFGSHGGWTEFTAYSEANRPAITYTAPTTGAMTQASSGDATPTANTTVGGFFLTTNATKGSEASGEILFTRKFAANETVSSGTPVAISGATISLGNEFAVPGVAFSANVLNDVVPMTVTLTDQSTGAPVAWAWTVTDGAGHTHTSTAQNPTFTLTVAGNYSVTLVATNDEGPGTLTKTNYILADSPQAFVPITSMRIEGSGSVTVSPFGIPVTWGTYVSRTRRTRIFARYPAGPGGTLYPVQTEKFKHRTAADGDGLAWCAGHVKIPGYTSREKIEIGYSDTQAPPSNATITMTDDFSIELTRFEPPVYWLSSPNLGEANGPYGGDIIDLSLTDDRGSITVSHEVNRGFSWESEYDRQHNMWSQLARKLSEHSSGRWDCYGGREVVRRLPWQRSIDIEVFTPRWGNSTVYTLMGYSGIQDPNISNPRSSTSTAGNWPLNGFYFWGTSRAGDYTAPTVTISITRRGSLVPTTASGGALGTTLLNRSWKLPYDGGTGAFTVGRWVTGLTSGAVATVRSVTGTTTAGTLWVDGVKGTFLDNEAIVEKTHPSSWVNGVGAAVVNGSVSLQTITSSSGGSAQFHGWEGGTQDVIFIVNRTGAWNIGDTVTTESGGTATIAGAVTNSTFSAYTNATTLSQSGTLQPLNTVQPKAVWQANWNAATATPDSPWTNGHSYRFEERRMALTSVAGSVADPNLYAWFMVGKDRDGVVVHRSVTVTNCELAQNAKDEWYDANVKIGGVSQTGTDPRWKHLFHVARSDWRWRQDYTFGMCDPADFMRGRMIMPYLRFPTWNVLGGIDCKVRGKEIGNSDNLPEQPLAGYPDGTRDYVKATRNDPFYPGNFDFTGWGGARGELGEINSWEYMFWAGDSITAWPGIEAMADNVAGARPQRALSASADADKRFLVPNLYYEYGNKPWGLGKYGFTQTWGRPSDGTGGGESITQLYKLHRDFHPMNSHSPSIGTYSAWLVRPEKRFRDNQHAYAWTLLHSTQSWWANDLNVPKTGGTPGDADHIVGVQPANGQRTFVRPAQQLTYCAIMAWEGARDRAYWLRVVQDQCDFINKQALNTIWGAFIPRQNNYTSDNKDFNIVPYAHGGSSQLGSGWTIDFKAQYVDAWAYQVRSWGVGSLQPYIDNALWTLLLWQQRPWGLWYRSLNTGYDLQTCYIMNSAVAFNPDGTITYDTNNVKPLWIDTDMSGLKAFLESADTPTKRLWSGQAETEAAQISSYAPGECNYNRVGFFIFSGLLRMNYSTNPTWRAVAEDMLDTFETKAPAATLIPGNFWGLTYSQVRQQNGAVKLSVPANW